MKNNKGFTLAEVIVCFSLIMIVMIYLLRTIVVINEKQSTLLIMQEYTVLKTNLLNNVYEDLNQFSALTITSNENSITFNEIGNSLEINENDNYIIYNDTIYELPTGASFDKSDNVYEIISSNTKDGISDINGYFIIKINLLINNQKEQIKIVFLNM